MTNLQVEQLKGWHLVKATLYKPGIYHVVISKRSPLTLQHHFVKQTIITTARELGYLSAPNGFTLP